MYSPYNPCCTGSFYGTGCTADCPSQQPVPRTTGDLGGFLDIAGGWQQFVPTHAPTASDIAQQVERDVAEGFERIDAKIANLLNPDTSDCDPELLALAKQAIDAIAWRAYSKAWPEAMSGPDPGRLVVASREAVGRMREVIAALDRNGWPLFAHSLHLPMTLLERAASEAMSERCIINLGGGGVHTTLAQPVSLEWGDAP